MELSNYIHTIEFMISNTFLKYQNKDKHYDKVRKVFIYPQADTRFIKIYNNHKKWNGKTIYQTRIVLPDLSFCYLPGKRTLKSIEDIREYLLQRINKIPHKGNREMLLNNIKNLRIIEIHLHKRIKPTKELREFFHTRFRKEIDKFILLFSNTRSIKNKYKRKSYSPVYINKRFKTVLIYDEKYHPRKKDFIKIEIRLKRKDHLLKGFGIDRPEYLFFYNWDNLSLEKLVNFYNSEIIDLKNVFESDNRKKIRSVDKSHQIINKRIYDKKTYNIRLINEFYQDIIKDEKKSLKERLDKVLKATVIWDFPRIDIEIDNIIKNKYPDIYSKIYLEISSGVNYSYCYELIDPKSNEKLYKAIPRLIPQIRKELTSRIKNKALTREEFNIITTEVNNRLFYLADDIRKEHLSPSHHEYPKKLKSSSPIYDYSIPRERIKRQVWNILLHPEGENLGEFIQQAHDFISMYIREYDEKIDDPYMLKAVR